ncbi:N-acetylglucosamine kinase [Pedobacter cryoconitis]|uniref:N-acetylglucosamine kinase-like BadF-type ATPase n=1 Tax=Pedobacter cryoconitis TaxID=188932 RepID=A0A7X0J5T4_9SPHI|nr:N-acetylglucosamine kinase [Pedobacter cryoconitis]MBB6501390.1 N-acetylglucosamine kinase-like BadF-type ATPase [Pedobacter cryoconitis]
MILVADSGSSKTDWLGYKDGKTISFSTQGINPYFLNAQDIFKILSKTKIPDGLAEAVKEIYFYGSGCSTPDKHEVISNGLSLFFTKAYISVENDLVGSAYATCGDEKGLICILGTGSNVSYYDGVSTYDSNYGLGYILGDEGSGTSFGKKIITSYLYKQMPDDLRVLFAKEFETDKETVITNVYQKPLPNTYLAGFSRFMYPHREHPFIHQLLIDGFQEFIDVNIKNFKDYKTLNSHFVGSVAFYYEDTLRKVYEMNGLRLGKVMQKPIEGIYNYILKKEGIIKE